MSRTETFSAFLTKNYSLFCIFTKFLLYLADSNRKRKPSTKVEKETCESACGSLKERERTLYWRRIR